MRGRVRQWVSVAVAFGVLLSTGFLSATEAGTPRRAKTTSKSAAKPTAKKTTRSTAKKAGASNKKKGGPQRAGKAKRSKTRGRARRSTPVVAFDPARPQTLRAEAAVVVDTFTGDIVWAKNAYEPRSIASLTKLMTALVFLDNAPPLTDSLTITTEDVTGAGRSHVRARNRVSVNDLLHCSLISSDNAATRALARSTGLAPDEFVRRMNVRAQEMGLKQTRYVEVTGLDPANESTAADQARLIGMAAQDPTIAAITSLQQYSFRCSRRVETLNNTNRLLRVRSDVRGGKTGFNRPAGYCLATLVGGGGNPQLTTVVLGAPTNASRFAESSKLINWALSLLAPSPAQAGPIGGGTGGR